MNTNYDICILLIDERPPDVLTVEDILVNLGYRNILRVISIIDAFNTLETVPPSLIIADIFLDSQKSWSDFLNYAHDKIPTIVVTTSNEDSLYHSITQIGKIAYLVKPIHRFTLGATIKLLTKAAVSDKTIYLNGNYIYFNDIYFFEVNGNYSFVHTRFTKFVIKYSLNKLMEKLDNRFVKTHHSFLVNIYHVKSCSSKKIYLEKHVLPLSRTYKKEFIARFANLER